jgi:hypothetical protein
MTGTASAVRCCAHFQHSPLNTTCPFYRVTARQLSWSFTAQSASIRRQYLVSLQFSSLCITASFHLPALAAEIQHNQRFNGDVPPYKENRTAGGLAFILYTEILQILTVITSLYQPPHDLFLSIFPGAFPLQDP